jgi:hypothetical protein
MKHIMKIENYLRAFTEHGLPFFFFNFLPADTSPDILNPSDVDADFPSLRNSELFGGSAKN